MKPWMAAVLGVVIGALAMTLLQRSDGAVDPVVEKPGGHEPSRGAAPVTPAPSAPQVAPGAVPVPSARAGEGSPDPSATAPLSPPAPAATAPAPVCPPPVVTPCEGSEAAWTEASALRGKVAELEQKLARIDPRTFDLSRETLLRLAERCELRWDLQPPRLDGPARISKEAAAAAGLADEELSAVDEVLASSNDRLLAAVRALYVEVTGDSETDNLAPEAMLAEMDDKTDPAEIKRVFQQLSAERAGLATAPADLTAAPPMERLYRLLTSAGDALEGELGARIGADRARALREHDGGWNSRSRSSHGCP